MASGKKNEKGILNTFKGEMDEALLEQAFLTEENEGEMENEAARKNRIMPEREQEVWNKKNKDKKKTNEKKQKRQERSDKT